MFNFYPKFWTDILYLQALFCLLMSKNLAGHAASGIHEQVQSATLPFTWPALCLLQSTF